MEITITKRESLNGYSRKHQKKPLPEDLIKSGMASDCALPPVLGLIH